MPRRRTSVVTFAPPPCDRRAEVDDRRPGRHLGRHELVVGRRRGPVGQRLLPGSTRVGAVVGGEVDECDHRRELHLRVRLGQVHPHRFVAVDQLLLRAGTAIEDVRDVELVRAQLGSSIASQTAEVHGVREDLRREDRRLRPRRR